MSTLSIPITEKMEQFIQSQISQNKAETKAEVVRRALTYFAEQQAVAAVLESEQDIREGKLHTYTTSKAYDAHIKKLK